jgi:hypothetical protein
VYAGQPVSLVRSQLGCSAASSPHGASLCSGNQPPLALALAPPAQHGDPFNIFENVFGGGGGGQRMHFQFGGGGGGFGGGGAWHGLLYMGLQLGLFPSANQ